MNVPSKDDCPQCGAIVDWDEYDDEEDTYIGQCSGPTPHKVTMTDDDETWK